MKFKLKATIPILVFVSLFGTTVQGSAPDRLGAYDFSYQSTGDLRVRPAQVFDDGRSTYFQFRAGEPVPAIFAVTQNGPSLLVPEAEGPYIRVADVASGYVLRLGYGLGKVAYTGGGRTMPAIDLVHAVPSQQPSVAVERLIAASAQIQGLPSEIMQPAHRVALEINSYATPIKGDRTVWTGPEEVSQEHSIPFVIGKSKLGPSASKMLRSLVGSMHGATRIEVTGRDDQTYREGLAESRATAIADALAVAGIPRSRIVIKTSTQVVQGRSKGVVVGASITTRTVPAPKQPEAVATHRSTVNDHVEAIVSQLRSGQLTPSQAAAALDGVRAASPSIVASPLSRGVGPWTVRKSDGTVENMLKRWGQDSGWRVLSRGAPSIEIHGDAEVDRREFLQAADYAITQAKQAGYRIKATAYSNNVLVLTGE